MGDAIQIRVGKSGRGELTALIGVDDLRLTIFRECLFKRLDRMDRFQRDRDAMANTRIDSFSRPCGSQPALNMEITGLLSVGTFPGFLAIRLPLTTAHRELQA